MGNSALHSCVVVSILRWITYFFLETRPHCRGERNIAVWRVVSAAFRDGAVGPRGHSCRHSLVLSQIYGLCPAVQAFCCVRAPWSHLSPVLGERAPPLTLPCRCRGQREPRFDAAAAHITSLRHSRVCCCCSAGRSGCGTTISQSRVDFRQLRAWAGKRGCSVETPRFHDEFGTQRYP